MNIIKIFIIIIALVILSSIIYLAFNLQTRINSDASITNFKECVAAGYPILKSYPGQCITADGRTFVDSIDGKFPTPNLIKVNEPQASSTIENPLVISGTARGSWFFEATFPVALYDANGTEIARHFAEARGDWMTNDFVSFSATLSFDTPQTKTGTVVLEKSNPSGLPANADSISIPVIFSNFTEKASADSADPH